MTITAKMLDLSKIDTGLTPDEARAAREECQRMKQRRALGDRYVLARANAPQRGEYNNQGVRLA
ncbi:hypothetical protein DFLDMN_001527 [Cupriavidus sp. H19C3]|uniref:hypothetical protein n=1 Tax=Cupriavidus sp. H19C3 TaxID=3241603 RepID=UPI003BF7A815